MCLSTVCFVSLSVLGWWPVPIAVWPISTERGPLLVRSLSTFNSDTDTRISSAIIYFTPNSANMDGCSGDWNGRESADGDTIRSRSSSVLRRFSAMPLPFLKLNNSYSNDDTRQAWSNGDDPSQQDNTLLSVKDDDSRDSGTYSMDDDSPNKLVGLAEFNGSFSDIHASGRITLPRRCLFDERAVLSLSDKPGFTGAFQKRLREATCMQDSPRKRRLTGDDTCIASVELIPHQSNDITSVVDYDEQDMISDYSRPYRLPSTSTKYQDLKAISSTIVYQLLHGEFSDVISNFVIIDCRYPYEFLGGHLTGATNIWEQRTLTNRFSPSNQKANKSTADQQNSIIIFHCEFSSHRAPKMARYLRQLDREANTDCYPALNYPEIYILEGGYKSFYEQYASLCEPEGYKPMLHPDHLEDVKHFRSQSKTEKKSSKSARHKRHLFM